jgi:hypothetical protein
MNNLIYKELPKLQAKSYAQTLEEIIQHCMEGNATTEVKWYKLDTTTSIKGEKVDNVYADCMSWLEGRMGGCKQISPPPKKHRSPQLSYTSRQEIEAALPESVFYNLSQYISNKTNEKFASNVCGIEPYLESLAKLKQKLTGTTSKQDKKTWINDFLSVIDPGEFAMDMRVFWSLDDFEKEYNELIDKIYIRKQGDLFTRYRINTEQLIHIKNDIVQDVLFLLPLIYSYAVKYEQFSKELRSDAEDMSIQLIDDTISSFMERQYDEEGSINHQWNHFFSCLEKSIQSSKQKYEAMLYHLYGNWLIQATKDLNKLGLTIDEIRLECKTFKLKLKEDELHRVRSTIWEAFGHRLLYENEAIKKTLCENVCVFLNRTQYANKDILPNGYSIYYFVQLHKFMTESKDLEELAKRRDPQFINNYVSLYKLLPIIINDKDCAKHGAVNQFELLLHFVHNSESNSLVKILPLFDYVTKMVARYDENHLYAEEQTDEYDFFNVLLVLVAKYLGSIGENHRFITMSQSAQIPDTIVKDILEKYKQQNGVDYFYRYFNPMTMSKWGSHVIKNLVSTITKDKTR